MISFTSITKLTDGSWRFAWDADSGVSYEVWLHGELIDTVDDGQYDCTHSVYYDVNYATTPPPIEVVAVGETAESSLYPPFLILQWKGIVTAFLYAVNELVDSVYVAKEFIQETLKAYYKYQTKMLDDVETATWKVEAQTNQGLAGTAVEFSQLMARNPDPPDVEIEFQSTGTFLVSEA